MDPRFVTKKVHAFLDYPVAFSLVATPLLLGLGSAQPLALWLSLTVGAAAFLLTVFTNHQSGVFPVLPYRLHLSVDALVGIVFLAAPTVLGFTGADAWYYWVNGAAVMTVVGLHKPEAELASPALA